MMARAALALALAVPAVRGFDINLSVFVGVTDQLDTKEACERGSLNWVDGQCYFTEDMAATTAFGLLAIQHFNDGVGTYVKQFETLSSTCKARLSGRVFDTSFSADKTVLSTLGMLDDIKNGVYDTTGIVGPSLSSSSIAQALIGKATEVPQVSYQATSVELDSTVYTQFMRTIPNDDGVAASICRFWKEKGYQLAGVLYFNDDYGTNFMEAVTASCESSVGSDGSDDKPFKVSTASYNVDPSDPGNVDSIVKAVESLIEDNVRVVLLVAQDSQLGNVVRVAKERGLYENALWMITDGVIGTDFEALDNDLRRDFNGTLRVAAAGAAPGNERWAEFKEAWELDELNMTNAIMATTDFPEPWLPYDLAKTNIQAAEISAPGCFMYDAVATFAIAMCELAEGKELTKEQVKATVANDFVATATKLQFTGLSGEVRFNEYGTRQSETATYEIAVMEVSDADADALPTPRARRVAFQRGEDPWTVIDGESLYYVGGNTNVDGFVDLVEPTEERFYSDEIKFLLYGLCGLNLISALFLFLWTLWKRSHIIIRASQVPFLASVAFGVFVSSSSIFLITLDDQTAEGDDASKAYVKEYLPANVGCMGSVWLYSVGFTITFGALFSRIWRIRRLFHNRHRFKRIVIPNSLLYLIIASLLVLDVAILLAWTLTEPLLFEREVTASDDFGNPLESVGLCTSPSSTVFFAIGGAFHVVVLLVGNYIAWTCRKINSTFSEGRYVGIAMWSYVQILLLAIPVLAILSSGNQPSPPIIMLMKGIIVFLNDLSILALLFGPKLLGVHLNWHDTSGQGGELFEHFSNSNTNNSESNGKNSSEQRMYPRVSFVPGSLAPQSSYLDEPKTSNPSLEI